MAQLGAALRNSGFSPLPPQHAILVSQLEQWKQRNLAFVTCIKLYGAGFSMERWGGVFLVMQPGSGRSLEYDFTTRMAFPLLASSLQGEDLCFFLVFFLIQRVWTVSTSQNWATNTYACLCLRVCMRVQRACSDVVRAQDLNYFPVWISEHAVLMYCQFCFLPFGIKFKMLKK